MHRRDPAHDENVQVRQTAPHRSPIYGRLVPAYNAFWPAVAARRIGEAIRALPIASGSRLLEVGVGTGVSLKHYPKDISITGVDLSDSMLASAAERISDHRWDHIDVQPMNAEDLQFEDSAFDIVTSFHTISVVSDAQRMMSEIVRVCRPGGKILIINHFRSENPLIASVVDRASDFTKRLGWRTDLDSQRVLAELPVRLDQRYKANPLSLFTILEATCDKPEPVLI